MCSNSEIRIIIKIIILLTIWRSWWSRWGNTGDNTFATNLITSLSFFFKSRFALSVQFSSCPNEVYSSHCFFKIFDCFIGSLDSKIRTISIV
jgi:hypothetical protein